MLGHSPPGRIVRRAAPLAAALALIAALLPVARLTPSALAASPSFTAQFLGGRLSYALGATVGDLDGDGDLDIALAHGTTPAERSLLYLNDGSGGFGPSGTPFGSPGDSRGIAAGDLDNDGDLDIVQVTVDRDGAQPSRIYLNPGDARFGDGTPFGGGRVSSRAVALGDLNGDGFLDIVRGNQDAASEIFFNDGRGGFPAATALGEAQLTEQILIGDVDADGLLDIVQANLGVSSVYFNAGGQFPTATPYGAPGGVGAALGDLNGDRYLDIVQTFDGGLQPTPATGVSQYYLNTGGRSFGEARRFGEPERAFRAAVADVDGDGLSDIIQSNYGSTSKIFLGDGIGGVGAGISFGENAMTLSRSIALADFNGDGATDIVQGGDIQQSVVYLNHGPTSFPAGTPLGARARTSSVAVGDLDDDGALDVVRGIEAAPLEIFRGLGQGAFPGVGAPLGEAQLTVSVALGDMDGDGLLDIVQGIWNAPVHVYLNGSGGFTRPPVLAGDPTTPLSEGSIALGDMNGDGALDIVQGVWANGPGRVYLNAGDGAAYTTSSFGVARTTYSVALGDMNSDGALDIVQANASQPSLIFLNDGRGGFGEGAQVDAARETYSVALGDMNGDGALDIVQGNWGEVSALLLNDGRGAFPTRLPFGGANQTESVAVGDVNGDGRPDIVQANIYQPGYLYLHGGAVAGRPSFSHSTTLGNPSNARSVALGDMNGDGALDIVRGSWDDFDSRIFLNRQLGAAPLPSTLTAVRITRPGPTPDADFYSAPALLTSPVISVTYELIDPQSDPAREVRGFFSLDGGGTWRPAIASGGTITRTLEASPAGVAHTFGWDTFASGFFGQSDNVMVRIVAHPSLTVARNEAPIFLRGAASATTFRFRARGTQVRVVDERQAPMPGAVVFRLSESVERGEQLIAADRRSPAYTTDAAGFLRGRGQLNVGEQLVALAPVPLPGPYADAYSQTVRLYHTNIITTPAGLAGSPIRSSGVQTVTVSASRPLALFDLSISLEWDARGDARFMAQLENDIARASELLFQASHGQAALGGVTIFHSRENWDYANIRLYASNRVRPSALIGGIATRVITDPTTLGTVVYGPGQVKIGAVWNRFGAASGNLSEDWPRTLVHELGHYLLFLEDNYVGLNSAGRVVSVTTCPGIMADTYASLWQFQPAAGWRPGCEDTLSNRSTGRADWQTITTFYPGLRGPQSWAPDLTAEQLPAGPARQPLALTEITSVAPLSPTQQIDVPIFYTTDRQTAERVAPSLSARAYLFRSTGARPGSFDQLTPLGRANNGQVLARGASVGDRVCLFEPLSARFGCAAVQDGQELLPLVSQPAWQPQIEVTPVTSRTLQLRISGAPSSSYPLVATVYPLNDEPPPAPVTLLPEGATGYSGTVALVNPLDGAYIHLAASDGGAPVWETVTELAIGGNPGAFVRTGGGFVRTGGGFVRTGGGFVRTGGGFVRTGGGFVRTGGAPVASAEGDVIVVGTDLTFEEGQFLLLQSTSSLPPLPSWTTLVGQAYRFTTSPSAPDLSATDLSFSYLEAETPAGEEQNIRVYYRAPQASGWSPIATQLDTDANIATIASQGPGLYALLTSVRVPLPAAGWNNFAYPVQGSRPTGEALASIAGRYTVMYSYAPTDARDPWKVFAPGPSWVSDLTELTFGRGYWIYMTQPDDLLLNGAPGPKTSAPFSAPPATIYGVLRAEGGAPPAPGEVVEARIGGALCGSATTRREGDQVVFVVKVAALGPDAAACGAPGLAVSVTVAGRSLGDVPWDNTRISELGASAAFGGASVFLPLLQR